MSYSTITTSKLRHCATKKFPVKPLNGSYSFFSQNDRFFFLKWSHLCTDNNRTADFTSRKHQNTPAKLAPFHPVICNFETLKYTTAEGKTGDLQLDRSMCFSPKYWRLSRIKFNRWQWQGKTIIRMQVQMVPGDSCHRYLHNRMIIKWA